MSSSYSSTHGGVGVHRRTVAKSAVLTAGLLLTGGAGPAWARNRPAGGVTLRLPAPTGPHRIGVTTLFLVDRCRRDPWDPRVPVREVMATVRYPARSVQGRPVARQLTEGAAALFAEIDVAVHGLPRSGVNWAATRTHAHPGAPAQAGRWPVVLYSPGGGDPRTMGTGLAEELASHGFVVVTVDHPGDASEVEFPGTTPYRNNPFRTTVFRGDPRSDPRQFRTMIDTRIADLRFVLDQLATLSASGNPDTRGRALPEHLWRALDLRRVGIYGHSAGGTAAAEAMYEDRRIAAAVNMEGYLDHPPAAPGREAELYPVARYGVDRPLLLLGSADFLGADSRAELARSWSAMLAHPRGRTRRRQIDGAAHWVFTDYAVLAPALQDAGLMTAAARGKLVGGGDPARTVPAVRHGVRTFFARHLGRAGT